VEKRSGRRWRKHLKRHRTEDDGGTWVPPTKSEGNKGGVSSCVSRDQKESRGTSRDCFLGGGNQEAKKKTPASSGRFSTARGMRGREREKTKKRRRKKESMPTAHVHRWAGVKNLRGV